MKTTSPKRRRTKAAKTPDVAQSDPIPALATEAATDGDVTQTNGTIASGAYPQANGTDTDAGAHPQAIGAPGAGDEDANVNGADPRGEGHDVQPAIDELVRRYGGNLREWPEFPRVIAEAGLQPQDVTEMRLAMASLHLHQLAIPPACRALP